MNFTFLIFLFLLLFLLFTFLIKRSDYLSPARLFSLVWIVVLGLCTLKLSRYQYGWSWYSWTVITITIISFLLGSYVVYTLNFGKNTYSIDTIRKLHSYYYKLDTNTLLKVTILLFLTYVISYFIIYSVRGFLPAFSTRPELNRATWGLFGIGLFIHLAPVIIFLSLVYILCYKGLSKKIIFYLMLLITIISFIFLQQRFSIVIGIILVINYLYYGTKKINFKNVFLFIISITIIIYGISAFREGKLFIHYMHFLSKMKYSPDYALFTEPYMYLVMNVENFAYAVEKIEYHTYGVYSFDFLIALSGLKHLLKEYYMITDFPALRTFMYNTYTMFFVYYRDFGLLGSFIFPFILGFTISHFYYKMKYYPNFHTISLYGTFVIGIIFSYFIPLFSWLHFVFNIFVIYFISKYLQRKSEFITTQSSL